MTTGYHQPVTEKQFIMTVTPRPGKAVQAAIKVGRIIKEMRMQIPGLTAADLGVELDSNRAVISPIENGYIVPTRHFMERIVDRLTNDPSVKEAYDAEKLDGLKNYLMDNAAPDQEIKTGKVGSSLDVIDGIPELRDRSTGMYKSGEFSEQLLAIIKDAGISKPELAEIMELDEVAFERVLSGRAIPSDEIIFKIGSHLGLEQERISELIDAAEHDRSVRRLARGTSQL